MPVKGNGHRLAHFGGGGAADGLPGKLLGVVDNIVTRHRGDGNRWRNGIDGQGVRGLSGVTRAIVHAGGNGLRALPERGQIRRRHVQCPGAIGGNRGGIGFAAKGDGDRLPHFRAGRAVKG